MAQVRAVPPANSHFASYCLGMSADRLEGTLGMAVATASEILSCLQQYDLVAPSDLAGLLPAHASVLDPEKLRGVLKKQGGLTPYQVEAVLRGEAARLRFGPFLLLDRLADGGMGTVYKARHARVGRVVALKVIRHDKLKSKIVARRFLREIRLTANLEHPHIVRAFDAGVIGDQIYLATEFVTGRDLAAHVRLYGPMSVEPACEAVLDAALALQFIHEKRMIHRDVKPSNLMRNEATGRVKLLDLGLGGVHHDGGAFDSLSGTITRNGVLLGTPDYISPEQAQEPHRVDIRADLYSLGCTFHYLLTGRPPFVGGSPVDKLMRHVYEAPPQVQLPPGRELPPRVGEILTRLMAKSRDDRYPDPAALAKAVRERNTVVLFVATEAEANSPFAFEEITAPPGRKRESDAVNADVRTWLWLLGSLLVLVISAVLLALKFRGS